MKKFLSILLIINFYSIAKPIEVNSSESTTLGCNYKEDDFYKLPNTGDIKYIENSDLVNGVFRRTTDLFSFLENKISDYKFSRDRSVHSADYTLDKLYFEYKGAKVTIYRSNHHNPVSNKVDSKFLSFCYEGGYDNEIVDKVLPKELVEKLGIPGDGAYYIADSEGFHSIKLFRVNRAYSKIFIYGGYD